MIETDRTKFFDAMAQIRGGMLVGENKNLHVEPIVSVVRMGAEILQVRGHILELS